MDKWKVTISFATDETDIGHRQHGIKGIHSRERSSHRCIWKSCYGQNRKVSKMCNSFGINDKSLSSLFYMFYGHIVSVWSSAVILWSKSFILKTIMRRKILWHMSTIGHCSHGFLSMTRFSYSMKAYHGCTITSEISQPPLWDFICRLCTEIIY